MNNKVQAPVSNPSLWLASASPRRAYLLRQAGVKIRVMRSHVVEVHRADETPQQCVRRQAKEKALDVAERLIARGRVPCLVLGADTVVALGRRILGKPKDEAEAARMLRALSGQRHQVFTGVCLVHGRAGQKPMIQAWVSRTDVQFRKLSSAEIKAYIASGEPMDKAGAYGIQGRAAGMVEAIKGSYTNVVGLPLSETLQALRRR